MNWVKLGIFAGGVAFGSVGLKLLGSKDAKKVYAQVTAATLRAKESVMKTVTNVKENAGDILADAKDINEKRDAKNAVSVRIDRKPTVRLVCRRFFIWR